MRYLTHSDWAILTVGDIAEVQGGIQKQPKRRPVNNRYPFLRVGNVGRGTLHLHEIHEVELFAGELDRLRLLSGDLLVVEGNGSPDEVGRAAMWRGEIENCVYQNHLIRLRPKAGIVPEFLELLWNSDCTVRQLRQHATTTSGLHTLSAGKIRAIRVAIPPPDQQRSIVAVLGKAQLLQARRRKAIALLGDMTQAIFRHTFGDPLTNPHRFPVLPLVEWVDSSRPITYGILKPGEDQANGVKYVRVTDMKDGGIDTAGIRRTTAEISKQYTRSLLRPGDLLMSIRGHVGRLAQVPPSLEGANITQDSARIAVNSDSSRYMLECMRSSSIQHWMARRTKGAAVKGINLGDIKNLEIPVPPICQQRQFAADALHIDQLRSRAQAHLAELDALFASLQHRAFRGEL